MVKVEAVRIGDSPAAAMFTLIVGPSAETKEVGQAKKEIAERYGIRKRWWTQLVERSAKSIEATRPHLLSCSAIGRRHREGAEVACRSGNIWRLALWG